MGSPVLAVQEYALAPCWRRPDVRNGETRSSDALENCTVEAPDTYDISIWFVYSIEYSSLAAKGTIGQEHGRQFEIKIGKIPASEFIDGKPHGRVVEYAEKSFLANHRFLVKPDEDIFRWEARLNAADGPVLSRFEMYVR